MAETATLAEYTVSTTYDEIPTDAVDHAKRAIRDYLGVAVYGSHHEVGDQIMGYVDRCMPGEEATVIGRETASPTGAALANATFGHAIDYDDTFESIVIHPSSPVFGATLAAGEVANASGEELITAYTVGCEAAYRVGHSTYPNHYQNGWHSTGTVGTFGSAAAAAHLLDLSVDETITAFGIVASASSALKKNFGSMTKPLHAGHAAENGVRAALLAENGFTADNEILEGKIGYGEVMTTDGSYDPEIITEGLGEEWAVLDLGFKPHPSGVITHAAMDALRTLVIDHDLTPESVDSMTVALDDAASEMLHHANPDNALQAKFSIEFCLAAILRERKAGIHEFTDEYVSQPETAAVIDKIDRAFEENLFDAHYASYGARVTVETTDGETLVQEVKHHPGSPNNPVSEERLRAKFDECVLTVLDDDGTDQLAETIDALEDVPSVENLVDKLQP
ncbi:MmgE/PrpD family protein [Halohasta litorea]|uniref:MmgE/PrpD family protein n=1 Tax=Halohasta litorea TaxID=869891 RepID=A0ABD6DAE8_9EURY|nr:MmgE/PrpD family protein [Halohasta litorea]